MFKRLLLVFSILFFSLCFFDLHTYAANNIIYPIEVDADTGINTLENNFIYSVKEYIRQSSNMGLTSNGARIVLKIRAMPRNPDYPESSIIYSIIWLFQDDYTQAYLNDVIGYCGSQVYDSAAKTIVASTDELISKMKKDSQY